MYLELTQPVRERPSHDRGYPRTSSETGTKGDAGAAETMFEMLRLYPSLSLDATLAQPAVRSMAVNTTSALPRATPRLLVISGRGDEGSRLSICVRPGQVGRPAAQTVTALNIQKFGRWESGVYFVHIQGTGGEGGMSEALLR